MHVFLGITRLKGCFAASGSLALKGRWQYCPGCGQFVTMQVCKLARAEVSIAIQVSQVQNIKSKDGLSDSYFMEEVEPF